MRTIVYSSRADHPESDAELAELLAVCRANNTRADLTGVLLYRDGRFLQVLEGPDDEVQKCMTRISGDPRHRDIAVLLESEIEARRFPEWTMGYAVLTDAMAEELPGYRSSFDDLADADADEGIAPALRILTRWYRERTS